MAWCGGSLSNLNLGDVQWARPPLCVNFYSILFVCSCRVKTNIRSYAGPFSPGVNVRNCRVEDDPDLPESVRDDDRSRVVVVTPVTS